MFFICEYNGKNYYHDTFSFFDSVGKTEQVFLIAVPGSDCQDSWQTVSYKVLH